MSPEAALATLRAACDGPQGKSGWLHVDDVRRVIDRVDDSPSEPVLRITETEAAWILGRWTPEKADLAARALAEHAHAERAAGREETATQALDLADEITEASR